MSKVRSHRLLRDEERALAISAFDFPAATNSKTCLSRSGRLEIR
jgi:hypothetical protein